MNLTAKETKELAQSFHELSKALADYRFQRWKSLSQQERRKLKDAEWELRDASEELVTEGVRLSLDETEVSFQQVKKASNKARRAVKTLKRVKKIIKIAEKGVRLAAAIMAKDPVGTGKGAVALWEEVREVAA